MKTIEIYADTRGRATCRGCHAPIEWAEIVATGKKMCFNGQIVVLSSRQLVNSLRVIELVDLATNHWAACPQRDQFRRKRA